MEDINRLEKYIEQKGTKKNSRRKRFIILITILTLIAIVIFSWRFGFIDFGSLKTFFEKPNVETVSTVSEKSVKKEKPTIEIKDELKSEKQIQYDNVLSSSPSLIIKGEFIAGLPLTFMIKDHGGLSHALDFGDGRDKKVKRKVSHTYNAPGEYQVAFYPENKDQAITETIFIHRYSSIKPDTTFENVCSFF